MTTTEAFETWVSEQKLFSEMAMRRRDMAGSERLGEYVNPLVQFGWLAYQAATERAAKQEREECAKLYEEFDTNNDIADCWLETIAAAIRARDEGVRG